SDWNSIIAELTTIIWTDNATTQTGRKIMIGTANWGGVPGLYELSLPAACTKDNTIITVHYYEPFHFTHQGADWSDGANAWIGTTWTGSASEQAPLIKLMNSIDAWNTKKFEVYMGEFGAYSKHIEPEYQKAWTAFIAREAEKRKMSWAYWEYFSGFGAWNPDTEAWRPQIINALIPIE
ncbi:MAG TPA: glycoside hydrolase family 5 protein, partial [Treponema sp.]|nr:glycoside hydrolase family 5 protein [Treponema sp.]